MPFFSIILPTFNSASTIRECIDSILSQSFSDFEILIMDGLSSDTTLDVANTYGDTRIRIFSQKDSGVYDAMNKGIEEAKGEWLYFLGSDDNLANNDVLLNVSITIKEKQPDLIYGYIFYKTSGEKYGGEFTRKIILNSHNISHQSIFYKKELFSRLGKYNTDFHLFADWDFNIRCFSIPDLKIEYIDIPIAYYNEVSGISTQWNDTNFLNTYPFQAINRYNQITNSPDFKIGYYILKPIRVIANLFRRKNNK